MVAFVLQCENHFFNEEWLLKDLKIGVDMLDERHLSKKAFGAVPSKGI